MLHGMYRDGDWVQVAYQGQSIAVPRTTYELGGYEPPFDELITKEQFDIHAQGVTASNDA